ncbi:MAG TPA: hypothetical protein VGM51_13095 [Armatimonadota bacterium]|jgi:hypothetical protein
MKTKDEIGVDDIPKEIDFNKGVRGKHHVEYAKGTNIVRLDPDVASLFPSSEAVNTALRLLASLARQQVGSSPAS